MTKTLTIVSCLYNEEKALPLFYSQLLETVDKIDPLKYKVNFLFLNNCSTDRSLEILRELASADSRVNFLSLARNFGYQASLLAGLNTVSSDLVFICDCDGEDPPHLLVDFLALYEKGHRIVYGERAEREEGRTMIWIRKVFYRVLRFLSDSEIILDMAEFSLFDQTVKKNILDNSNTFPFIRSDLAYVGFNPAGIKYKRRHRLAGQSKYNLYKMYIFAVAGILTTSTFPMRISAYAMPFLIVIDIITLAFHLIRIDLLIMLNLMLLIITTTLVNLYIARIYKNAIRRPVFIIDYSNSKISWQKNNESES
ncbi:MAG TPA: glycosyltransferase family 2 protein [Chitinophagaceae bacterium]|nr:glycosyltransferase family 2 protein [Chitinophagaceae bacterium]